MTDISDIGSRKKTINSFIDCSIAAIESVRAFDEALLRISDKATHSIKTGGQILVCGNGGSASDADHIVGELVGRFEIDRPGLPAVSLASNSASLTAIANDFSFEDIYSRQVDAIGRKGDILLGLSTSGNSENIYRAVECANRRDIYTIGFLGRDGGRLAPLLDESLIVKATNTARIQEAHILMGHIMCAMIEAQLNE